jgi:DNA alkylation repair enzyme
MSDVADFVDAALQREGSWHRAEAEKARLGSNLDFYGASVGAVRGTIRDAGRRYPNLTHDDITKLSSELWAVPVFERRLATVVLLQSSVPVLFNSDLTRIEGFVREARLPALVDPLALDVIGPLLEALGEKSRMRTEKALDRWASDDDVWVRRAALLAPLRALRAGRGDWTRFERHASTALADPPGAGQDLGIVREAVSFVLADLTKHRPELRLSAHVGLTD